MIRLVASPRKYLASVLLLIATSAFTADALATLHLALRSSNPTRNEQLGSSPAQIRLSYTAAVTASLCKVTLVRAGSDSGITLTTRLEKDSVVVAPIASPLAPGAWEIRWTVAGADGHPISGVIPFQVNGTPTDSGTAASGGGSGTTTAVAGGDTADSGAGTGGGTPLGVVRTMAGRLGRLAVYGALFIALGAIGISTLLVPRLRGSELVESEAFPVVLDRMALTVGVVAGFLLVVTTAIRTFLQYGDVAAVGMDISLADFLSTTSVGVALALSTVSGAIVAVSSALARRSRTNQLWRFVQIAAVVFFLFFWASSGHAATAEPVLGFIRADVPLVLHILAAGLWIGTLSVIFVTVLPFALRDPTRIPALRATIWAFSPVALTAAAVMALSGALNAFAQLETTADIFTSAYGRTLAVKILVVLVLIVVGAYNWRVVRHRLSDMSGALKLRSTARLELTLAVVVLIITAILVATPPPHWLPGAH